MNELPSLPATINVWVDNLDKNRSNSTKRKFNERSPPSERLSSRLRLKGPDADGVDPVVVRLKKQRNLPLEPEDYMGDWAFLAEAVFLSVTVDIVSDS